VRRVRLEVRKIGIEMIGVGGGFGQGAKGRG